MAIDQFRMLLLQRQLSIELRAWYGLDSVDCGDGVGDVHGLSCMVTSTEKVWRKRATARRHVAFPADILILGLRYVLYGSTHNTSGA